MEGNPYWMLNRVTNRDTRTRTIASLTANVKATDWLTIQARGTGDYIGDKTEQKMWASTSTSLTGGDWDAKTDNGRYMYGTSSEFMVYGDLMAMINKTWGKFSLNAALGAAINYQRSNSLNIDSYKSGLHYPNVFDLRNVKYDSGTGMETENNATREVQSVFGTAQIGYADALYLDLTARNDWSSTLYGTNSLKKGYFYPSVGLSWLIHKSINLPDWINFAKIRGSFAEVGNDLPRYQAHLYPQLSIGGNIEQL